LNDALKRDRLITVRLSNNEYEHVRAAFESEGGRNISDFSRSKLLTSIARQSEPPVDDCTKRLGQLLVQLTNFVAQLSAAMERSYGANLQAKQSDD
jgi:hypothetical protein